MEQIPEFANHKYGIDMMDPSRPSSFIFLNPLAQNAKATVLYSTHVRLTMCTTSKYFFVQGVDKRESFGIDFGVGDVIVPKQEKRKIPTQLDDFVAPTVNTYSIETTVAEKIDAILSLMEFLAA